MKEIYDEKYKVQKERSNSKNSRKNDYSSTESYDNIMSQYKKSIELTLCLLNIFQGYSNFTQFHEFLITVSAPIVILIFLKVGNLSNFICA